MSENIASPPEFDPRWMNRVGFTVLEDGLPALPEVLDYTMSFPVAFWTATSSAVVLFLRFSRHPDGSFSPLAVMMTYTKPEGVWTASPHVLGVGWSHDPIADPQGIRDLDGQVMVQNGGTYDDNPGSGKSAAVAVGRVAPAVTQLALIQDGEEDERVLQSYFGAWVVCVEHWSPYRINALDDNGAVLASVAGPPRLPTFPDPSPRRHGEP